jgi:hypothetical protein
VFSILPDSATTYVIGIRPLRRRETGIVVIRHSMPLISDSTADFPFSIAEPTADVAVELDGSPVALPVHQMTVVERAFGTRHPSWSLGFVLPPVP